jgi:NAD(P)-dependent dehydrogenase (short-subunit alcohol dehydrogenase family)
VAIVTGGGRGIGRAVALALAAQGASVMVNDLGGALDGAGKDAAVAEKVCQEIRRAGGQAKSNADTIAALAGADRMVAETLSAFGRVDAIICCAGNSATAPLWEMTEAQWDSVLDVHLKGHFACTRAVAGPMRRQRSGRIVHITSHVGLYGHPEAANYASAKAGVTGLTRSAALSLGPFGITVNAIAPSAVTRMSDTVPVDILRARAEQSGIMLDPKLSDDEIRLAMIGTPEAVGNFAAYLCTDKTAHINGEVFAVIGSHISRFGHWVEVASLDGNKAFSVEEIVTRAPDTITKGVVNPAPPA